MFLNLSECSINLWNVADVQFDRIGNGNGTSVAAAFVTLNVVGGDGLPRRLTLRDQDAIAIRNACIALSHDPEEEGSAPSLPLLRTYDDNDKN